MIASLSINNDHLEEGCTLFEKDDDIEWKYPNNDRTAINYFGDEKY